MLHTEILSQSFDKLKWLQLCRTENIGPKTFISLLELYKKPEIALENIPQMAKNGGKRRQIKIPSESDIKQEIEQTENFGAQIICAYQQNYPKSLLNIEDFPPVITVKGNLSILGNTARIAIVGSRDSSVNGCKLASEFSRCLANKKFTIVSGLAKGIDSYAHKAALDFDNTIGVTAAGIDNIYPLENENLYLQMYQNGLVLTEHKFGSKPIASHFPKRNRIISGLSLGVIIVEAAIKSGTLITADYARKQSRMVFAVPGSPMNIRHRGTNKLLKEGAIMAEDYLDVINACNNKAHYFQETRCTFQNLLSSSYIPSEQELAKHRRKITDALGYESTSIDDLLEFTQIDLRIANYIILELELAGKVERVYGNKLRLLSDYS